MLDRNFSQRFDVTSKTLFQRVECKSWGPWVFLIMAAWRLLWGLSHRTPLTLNTHFLSSLVPNLRTCPCPIWMTEWNLLNTWLDGWCTDASTATRRRAAAARSTSTVSSASAASRPVVGSCKTRESGFTTGSHRKKQETQDQEAPNL